jgi:predicted transcriptional regulator
MMRTTIELPDDLHALARQLAHDSNRTMSEVVSDLMEAGLNRSGRAVQSGARGLPQVAVGRVVTAEDVRSLDDQE